MARDGTAREIEALEEGRGALPLAGFRATRVSGRDAAAWLQDLVTADVRVLGPGEAVRSLLLGPTGRIRADVHVLRRAEDFLLVQALDQPRPIGILLEPYVLSSEVALEEASSPDLVAVPSPGSWRFVPPGDAGFVIVGPEATGAWRIRHGLARFPVDLDEDSLPAEAGLDDGITIDRAKGCYLGQESVAKVRNLGHPSRVILALQAQGPARPGQAVLAAGVSAGVLTSVDASEDLVRVLARVRWDAREADLRSDAGVPLLRA